MSASCCNHHDEREAKRGGIYRRVLWFALAVNAGMFIAEIIAGLLSGSVALQADALDFLADAGNYAVSLFVIGMALRFRARAALFKGITMGAFGLWVIASAGWHLMAGTLPDAGTMGIIGVAALVANGVVLIALWSYRGGDSNMRSVWVCSRNDVIGNVAVLAAALGVLGTGTGWPDAIVAAVMAALALQGAWTIIRQAQGELATSVTGKARADGRQPAEAR